LIEFVGHERTISSEESAIAGQNDSRIIRAIKQPLHVIHSCAFGKSA